MDIGVFNKGFREYLAGVPFDVGPEDYLAMESRLALIEQMAEVQGSSVVVYDFYRQNYLLRKIRFSGQLGHDQVMAEEEGLGYFVSLVHPEDAPVILDTYLKAFGFLESLAAQERKNYKLVYNFRSRGKDVSYHAMVDQVVVLELDRGGNIWLLLGLTDLLPTQHRTGKTDRQFVNLKDHTLYLFNNRSESAGNPVLSAREAEVLGLVARGFASKRIAEQLYISVNTVNNHRQKILEKTRASNTAEAVAYARTLGLV